VGGVWSWEQNVIGALVVAPFLALVICLAGWNLVKGLRS
jgi:hypothetical protein